MNLITTLILAFGMSMDAFAAALGKGATLNKPGLRAALRVGIIFGIIETITPIIGWVIGQAASKYVIAWDHWLAFILLSFLGGRMIIGGIKDGDDKPAPGCENCSVPMLALTAVATSLDALAVGVGLVFLQVNILYTALAIGAATTIMATIGVFVGRFIGPILGKWAEILGGLVLIGIGVTILVQHLGLLS